MTIATVLAALLPVIPQPTQWTPSGGECDLANARVTVSVSPSSNLGEEGYLMSIGAGEVNIVVGGTVGRIWAAQTLAQLKASGAKAQCGEIRDVPKYRTRGLVMDVGRMYHSMGFMRDLALTMSYYKLNTLHVHLSDNEIVKASQAKTADWSKKYAAFRLECETCPELTAKDGSWTKKEFRDFMKWCRTIGVTVVPEIDVPAHSLAFTRVRPDFASREYGADHLDLDKTDEIIAWLKPIFAEYMTGPDPVFAGPYVHVGTDEYNKKEAEKFRRFTDLMLKMVAEFGYKPCAWGALTHATGETPVIAGKDITMDIWHNPYYQPEAALKAGYTIVSVPDGLVYIVPFANYYYDYLNCKALYDGWEPRNVAGYTVPDEYMGQLAGGKFALWNDLMGKKPDGSRYTEADNWDRLHPAMQTLSQKMWTGARADEPWDAFASIADAKAEPAGVKSRHSRKLAAPAR